MQPVLPGGQKEKGGGVSAVEIGHTLYVKNSAEAVALYCDTFGLELGYHVKSSDGSFFHSELCENGKTLLCVAQKQEECDTYNNIVCLGLTFADEAAVRHAAEKLSAGGTVKRPVGSLPWSPCCAEVVDRFGVWWYLTVAQHQPDDGFDPDSCPNE